MFLLQYFYENVSTKIPPELIPNNDAEIIALADNKKLFPDLMIKIIENKIESSKGSKLIKKKNKKDKEKEALMSFGN